MKYLILSSLLFISSNLFCDHIFANLKWGTDFKLAEEHYKKIGFEAYNDGAGLQISGEINSDKFHGVVFGLSTKINGVLQNNKVHAVMLEFANINDEPKSWNTIKRAYNKIKSALEDKYGNAQHSIEYIKDVYERTELEKFAFYQDEARYVSSWNDRNIILNISVKESRELTIHLSYSSKHYISNLDNKDNNSKNLF